MSVDAALADLRALYRSGDMAAAGDAAQALLARAPDLSGALHVAGLVRARLGRFDDALQLLERARERDPRNAALHNHCGNTLMALGREDEAIARYDEAIELGLEDPQALNNRGAALQSRQRFDAAMRSFERALALRPDFADALLNRGELLLEVGQRSAGIASLQQARAADPDDARIAFALASLGIEPAAPHAPPEFVRQLFDQYAHHYDEHLTGRLGYRAPELLMQLLQPLGLARQQVVDLGCGTGLCGPLLRPLAARLEGVDLSAAMLEHARASGCYDALEQAEIVEWLCGRRSSWDLAVAADVLLYLGDLGPLFRAVRDALRPGGRFAFTVEAGAGHEVDLRPTRRFAHSSAYVRRIAEAEGFSVEQMAEQTLRREGGAGVAGLVVLLSRR